MTPPPPDTRYPLQTDAQILDSLRFWRGLTDREAQRTARAYEAEARRRGLPV